VAHFTGPATEFTRGNGGSSQNDGVEYLMSRDGKQLTKMMEREATPKIEVKLHDVVR
jgi:hypothetical protein